MKRITGVLMALFFTLFLAGVASAGPSRALIQEMGSTIAKDEVNIDLDIASQGFNVASANDTTLGNGNATVGGTTVSSVNVSLIDDIELRIGRLPGFRSYLALPAVSAVALNPAGNNYGLTVKGAIPGVPGLAAWLGYGMLSQSDIVNNTKTGDNSGSSLRLGAAYTWAGPVIVNVTGDYGLDSAKYGSGNNSYDKGAVTTMEAAAAVLYPVRPTLLLGVELHYSQMSVGDDAGVAGDQKFTITALAPAIGARAVAGNWTIDAVVALVGTSIKVDGSPALGSTLQDTSTTTVVGVPTLRVNYKF
ncbi:MAG: hypothetical protein HY265_08935 [Deltaproteobacteria bacterium]|nr:hypothetical protein [Deltaproteobacteria bacterium]